MAVKPVKYAISGVVGGIHVGTLVLDEAQGWKEPFKRSSDYPQTIGFITGLGLDALDILPEEGEAIALSSFPLLLRSIYEAVKHYLGAKTKVKQRAKQTKGRWKLIQTGREQTQAQIQTGAGLIGL